MGSEEPRRGDRRYTSGFPLKHQPAKLSRKSISGASAGVSSTRVSKTALTPISRLKKFQKLRDRNLRKEVLYRNNIRKHLKMLEETEEQRTDTTMVKSPQALKELAKLENGDGKEIENGVKENGGNNGLNGISEEHEVAETNGVEENGEVRRSPRRSKGKEVEVNEQFSVIEENDEVEEEEEFVPEVEQSPEPMVKEIEVDVKVIESPASTSSSRRRSTPRHQDVSSTLFDKEPDFSPGDFHWISDTTRITGRRPIRDFASPRKRKSDEFVDEEPRSTKRMAFTPSIPSPGWRFLSPFSLFKRSPRTVSSRPVDDSLFVNVSSTDSEIDVELDNSMVSPLGESVTEHPTDTPTSQSPNKSTSWLCRLM